MESDICSRVLDFVKEETRTRRVNLSLETTLRGDLGVDGDDAVELLDKFASKFAVDMASFKIDSHFGSEGSGCLLPIGFLVRLFPRSDGLIAGRENLAPVTIGDLVRAAESRKW